MVSIGPYNQSCDYSYMYNLPDMFLDDCHSNFVSQSSIYSFVRNNPDYSIFATILEISGLEDIYNDPQLNSTVFVSSNKFLEKSNIQELIKNIDKEMARNIIQFNTLNQLVNGKLLKASPIIYLYTKYKPLPKLLIENRNNETRLDNRINIIEYDIKVDNGLIHITDGIMIPFSY